MKPDIPWNTWIQNAQSAFMFPKGAGPLGETHVIYVLERW